MAGYFMYSLSWEKFQKFTLKPTKTQLKKLGEFLDDNYEGVIDELDKDDVAHTWVADAKDPHSAIQQRLASEDWYGDLSERACGIWECAINSLAQSNDKMFDFRCESDGVYWYVIQYCEEHAAKKSKSPAISRFAWPYGLQKQPRAPKDMFESHWMPYHSMRPPHEVQQMLEEAKAADAFIKAKNDKETYNELIDELIPTLETIANDDRMLFVQVDT